MCKITFVTKLARRHLAEISEASLLEELKTRVYS